MSALSLVLLVAVAFFTVNVAMMALVTTLDRRRRARQTSALAHPVFGSEVPPTLRNPLRWTRPTRPDA